MKLERTAFSSRHCALLAVVVAVVQPVGSVRTGSAAAGARARLVAALRANSTEAKVVSSLVTEFRVGFAEAVEAASDATADGALGSDLALVAQVQVARAQDGPATLEDYCNPPAKKEPGKGERVNANWMNYGQMYPGVIEEENEDGTVDVMFDDGFGEENIPRSRIETIDGPKKEAKNRQGRSSLQAC